MLRWKSSLKPAASGDDNPGTTNLVNDWSMDETSGTRADSHGSADLTDNNTVTSATGVISNAASFNPANSEYLSSSTQPVTGTVARATECWFKTSYSGTDSQCITDYGAGSTGARWRIEIDNGGLVALRIFGATKIWDSSWNDGNWHHLVMQVAASSDCDDVEVYVDGTLDTSASGASATVSIDTGTGSQRIGIRSNTTKGFNGQIDEFRNWNRVLTSAEITWLYNSGSGRAYSDVSGGGSSFPSTSLVGFYKLDESSGDALDLSGNSRTFTENGTVASTTGTIGGETVNVRTLDKPAGKYFSRTDDADFDVGDGEDFTISFWAKVSSSMVNFTSGGIFSKRNAVGASDAGYSIDLRIVNSDTQVRYNAVCDGTTTVGDSATSTGVATDAWAHYMMVFTADSTLVTYVNNAQYDSEDVSSVTGSLANSIDSYIGRRAYNSGGDIIADVTHLGFWKKALDSSERTALYNSGKVLAPAAPTPLQTRTVTFSSTDLNTFTIDSDSGQKIWTDEIFGLAAVSSGLRLWNGSESGNSGATYNSSNKRWAFSSAGDCTTWWENYYIRVKQDPDTGTFSDWINLTDAAGDIYTSCQPEYNNIGSAVVNYSGPGTWTTHAAGFRYQVEIYSASNRP